MQNVDVLLFSHETAELHCMRRFVVGVMGPGDDATLEAEQSAELLGELIAREGWVLLTGGRDAGVMRAAGRGAKKVAGSFVVGILPNETAPADPLLDLAIVTNMNEARNAINVLSSDVVVACGGGSGTASEIALALKSGKSVILLKSSDAASTFFRELAAERVFMARSPHEAIDRIHAVRRSR
jgi:uncharacterized protein (TIGR00725 family)